MKILIVEDNEIISNNIRDYFKLEKIESKQLFKGKGVVYELVSNHYDAIILDLGLGDSDGRDICREIREKGHNIPILILTARTGSKNIVAGLKDGADDYLEKPFDYEELLIRLKTIIRRTFVEKSNVITIGDYMLDLDKKVVDHGGKQIDLSSKELELLGYLVHNKGKVLSKENILEKVWGKYDDFQNSRTVDVYIGYLRKKLGVDFVKTKRGIGYYID